MRTMSPEEMDRLIDEHFAYEAAHDLEGVMNTFVDDAELDLVGFPAGPRRGKHQIRGFYEQLYKVFDMEEAEPLHRYCGENFMVDEVICTGWCADGWLFRAQGFGGRVCFRLLHVLEFRDGRIARENVWLDSDNARQQLLAAGAQPEAARR
jgi:ketosteroid isomerase-like protein